MAGSAVKKSTVLGVTGFIGSGKSRVSRFLAMRLSCPHLDADQIARDLMSPGKQGWLAIKDSYPAYIMADGQLDRVLLRQDIFSDPALKNAIDSLVHPLVRRALLSALGSHTESRIVVEVPLLFDAGWEELFDDIVLVYAEKRVCLKRVMLRDGVSIQQADQSFQCQMGMGEKIKRADHVIDNSCCWWDTQLQLLHLIDVLTD